MQKTETYQLNLIDTGDSFTPDPINENTQLLEAALSVKFGGDNPGWVLGTYTGTGVIDTPLAVEVGFKPSMVLACSGTNDNYCWGMMLRSGDTSYSLSTKSDGGSNAANPLYSGQIVPTETGFTVNKNGTYYDQTLNESGRVYVYAAFR